MRLIRNPEWKRLLALCLAGCALAAGLGRIWSPAFSLFALAVCGGCSLGMLIFYALHLRRIMGLTAYVEKTLRGEKPLQISRNREGEYAIFENELYKLSAALRTQLEQAEETRRLLADALADVSHQIKTPLTAMEIECQLLRREELPYGERLRLLQHLDSQRRRTEALGGMMLKMSRLEAGAVSFRTADISSAALWEQALSPLLIPLELKEISLEWRGVKEAALQCDLAWTAEALGAILKNCMEHTPSGGRITIAQEDSPIRACLTIQNSGPPIAEKDLPHLFERFYRGENAAPGSAGIGLAFARQVIARQNGVLTAKNAPGGPCFIATFYKKTV